MNVSLPAIEQQSPGASAKNSRGALSKEAQGFGKLLKSNDGGQGGRSLAAQRSEGGRDPRVVRLAAAPDDAPDDVSLLDGEVPALPQTEEAEAPEPSGDTPDAETDEGPEALLPLLTIVEHRPVKTARAHNAEPSQGEIGKAALTQPRASRLEMEMPVQGRPDRTVTVQEPADTDGAAGRPAQTAFGKALAANLGALATQAPDPPLPVQDLPAARVGDATASDALPATVERTEGRQRGSLLAEAVTGAAKPREAGDKRAEAKPATADPKPTAPALQPPAVSTGAPIVEALAAAPPSTAAATAHLATQPGATAPVQSLKIQLHSAELGMVTARLRISDGQLSIEVEVETQEAYNRLSGENEAIARALRSHGISVDQVVIQAPPAQGSASARDGTGTFADSSSSGAERNLSGNGDFGQSNGSGHRNAGYDNGHDADTPSPAQPRADGGSGHGVYI